MVERPAPGRLDGWPELVAEWHPTRNAGLQPKDVSHGSGRKVWWRCSSGPDHEWRASPNSRTAGGTGCPFCKGRRASVTNSLASLRPDLAKEWHPTNNGTLTPDDVVVGSSRPVWWRCAAVPEHVWRVAPRDRASASSMCPFCRRRRACITNSLARSHPEIAAEWHPTRNDPLTPDDVVAGSSRRVWWRCRSRPQHQWRATVSNRCRRGSRCPFCVGRRASDDHCLARSHPKIAGEWHPERNPGVSPRLVTAGSSRRVWWTCARGHEWRARVNARTRKRTGCPQCRCEGGCSPERSRRARFAASSGVERLHEERLLSAAHHRLEQIIVLLAHDPDVDGKTLDGFAAQMDRYLYATEAVLYPAVERARGGPLVDQRERARSLRSLVTLATRRGLTRACREHHLTVLNACFREHAKAEQRSVEPWIPQAMGSLPMDQIERLLTTLGGSLAGSLSVRHRDAEPGTGRYPGSPGMLAGGRRDNSP